MACGMRVEGGSGKAAQRIRRRAINAIKNTRVNMMDRRILHIFTPFCLPVSLAHMYDGQADFQEFWRFDCF